MTQRKLQALTEDECFALLREGRVGRLVYLDDLGPIAVPVNYAVADRGVIIRIEGGAKRAAAEQSRLAFEVDHIDEQERSAWSVIIRGPGREVPFDDLPELVHRMHGEAPLPWASGIHNTWLEITAEITTGRRFGEFEKALIV